MEELSSHAVVLGNSRLDEVVRPVLDKKFDTVVCIESDPHEMAQLEDEGERFIFGDPRHTEAREEADIDQAEAVLSLEEDFDLDRFLAEEVGAKFIAVSKDISEAEKLKEAGAHHVIVEDDAIEELLQKRLEAAIK
jgi:Trk K+ transport system NAD-binding subunit